MSQRLKTRVKICGIRSPEDIELAALYGADAVGFITEVPVESPRKLDSETAASLVSKVPEYLNSVLVIMPENSARALELIEKVSPDVVQIHSMLSLPELEKIREKTDIPIIKTLSLPAQEETEKISAKNAEKSAEYTEKNSDYAEQNAEHAEHAEYAEYAEKNAEENAENSILVFNLLEQVSLLEEAAVVDSILLDTGKAGKPGGTGCVHDWALSRRIARETRLPLILAGGLKPENVQEAIRVVSPYAVDTASGVETSGKKDAVKVKKFIEEVRRANAFL
jgi:phosphoribosylanthranilate isomerase